MKRLEVIELIKGALRESTSSLLVMPRVFKVFKRLFRFGDISRYYFYDLTSITKDREGNTIEGGLGEGFAVCVYNSFKTPYMAFFSSMGVLTGISFMVGKRGTYNIPQDQLDFYYDKVMQDLSKLKNYIDKHGITEKLI